MTDQLINQIFKERYQIQTLLGRQTGRRTFLAKDLNTQSQVVVKLLLFNPDFTWDDLKLFQREAETMRNLDHPAIPQYLDYFEVETEIGKGSALVQSYIEAKSLQDWIDSGRSFSEAELKTIAIQLLEVLRYLHSHLPPVIHRDIKPSNILLTDRSGNSPGTVYLVDFGSVQTVVQSGTITVVGTYGYMPPEQFGGKTTPASDLYSLGATLIYLITRSHPANLPTRRGRIQFETNSQISKRFQAWIKCLIQPDVEQRFNTAEKALETLQNDALPLKGFFKIKPEDTKIYLKKTDEKLHIIIPSFFQKTQLIINQKNITYIFEFFWMIVQRKSWPTKNVIKLEKYWHLINIWFKNDYFAIGTSTLIEAEWLLHELSDWLDLSIQETNRKAQPNQDDKSNNKLTPENIYESPNSNLVTSSTPPIIKPPAKPQCTIEKSVHFIEVTAPGQPSQSTSDCLGRGAGLILSCICLMMFPVSPLLGFLLFIINTVLAISAIIIYLANSTKHTAPRIILQIDQNIACLFYKESQPQTYLKQIGIKQIRDIQVVYRSPQSNSSNHHIQLRTYHDNLLLVGNRTHWLSKHEAYWIASELSDWLKVPVTEKEVSHSNETPIA